MMGISERGGLAATPYAAVMDSAPRPLRKVRRSTPLASTAVNFPLMHFPPAPKAVDISTVGFFIYCDCFSNVMKVGKRWAPILGFDER
jgi:hypothetical protein